MHLFNLKKSLVFLYIYLVALLAAVTLWSMYMEQSL